MLSMGSTATRVDFDQGAMMAVAAHVAPGEDLWGWSHGPRRRAPSGGLGYLIGVVPTRLLLLQLADRAEDSRLVRSIPADTIMAMGFNGARRTPTGRSGCRVTAALLDGTRYEWDIACGSGLGCHPAASPQQKGIEALHAWCMGHGLLH